MTIKWDKEGNAIVVAKPGRPKGSGAVPCAVKALLIDSPSPEPLAILATNEPNSEGATVNNLIISSLNNLLNGQGLDELSQRMLTRHQYDPDAVAKDPQLHANIITSLIDKLNEEDAEAFMKMGHHSIGETTSSLGSVTSAAGEKDGNGLLRKQHQIGS